MSWAFFVVALVALALVCGCLQQIKESIDRLSEAIEGASQDALDAVLQEHEEDVRRIAESN